MSKNRVKLNICGTDYVITSEDDADYILSVGKEVDKEMSNILKDNTRVSVTMAAVLTALQYCDKLRKSVESTDNMRIQIKDYLEDSSRSRLEAEEARREIERMKREVKTLKNRLEEKDKQKNKKEDNPDVPQPISKPDKKQKNEKVENISLFDKENTKEDNK